MNLRALVDRLRFQKGLLAILRPLQALATRKTLSAPQKRVLRALVCGWTLKSHRYLDGGKQYRLHPLTGESIPVSAKVARSLLGKGLLHSNQKFPAATLLLTARGWRLAQANGATMPTRMRVIIQD